MKVKLDSFYLNVLINGLYSQRTRYDDDTNNRLDTLLLRLVDESETLKSNRKKKIFFELDEVSAIRQCLFDWRNQEIQALVEHLPYLTVTPFAIASRNQNLRTHAESVASHKDNHIEHSCDSRRAKFHLADTSHESRVGKHYHLFHQKAYQNRISHSPNLFITIIDRCCHRAAKLLQFGENRTIPL